MKTSVRKAISEVFACALIAAAIFALACVLLATGTFVSESKAQSVEGRIAFGFDAGANKYWGNFTDNQFGLSGDLFIRWNILDWLSLHGAYNGGVIRYSTTTRNVLAYPQYFGQPSDITYPGHPLIGRDAGNNVRHGGWELLLSGNFFPEETFVPFVIGGVEALNFEPKTGSTALPLPNNADGNYSKNVLGGVVGLGFEMYITPKVTFGSKLLLHLTGTDWLDDYSDPNNFRQDVFLTFGAGFSYYIFAPSVVPPPVTDVSTETHKTVTNIYETNVYHIDTVFLKSTDTVKLHDLKVNTIVSFPSTFFIVNTDEFNTKVPGNMQNLNSIKALANQCNGLQLEIQGFASSEGTPERNQELSEMRARKVKSWLLEQGVDPAKIVRTVGYGTRYPMVRERTDVSAEELESERVQNRRIAVKVVKACD